jgi:ABC-type nickel/cobalt efflux system permease component RcnA
MRNSSSPYRGAVIIIFVALIAAASMAAETSGHPLGNFTINHFSRIETNPARIRVRYVIDMAEIPTFQETRAIAKETDGTLSNAELKNYLDRVAPLYAEGLLITVDGARVPLEIVSKSISILNGSGGLPTLRIACDFEGDVKATESNRARHLRFEDTNFSDRIGWREIVVIAAAGTNIFNSSAFGSAVTDELKTYPADMLAAPLDERRAQLSWTIGAVPDGAVALRTRDGRPAANARDGFAELIAVPEVTPLVALLGILLAAGLGALHALSPGHGKTIVGAYLIGSRGTARHAAFLGLTVTMTHTFGVFALGLITLFASQYILPERLFPILSFVSGAIVAAIGLSLFARRLRAAIKDFNNYHTPLDDAHDAHSHEHARENLLPHDHTHHGDQDHSHLIHSHGGRAHTHLPPGTDGSRVTWRSLLALGVSGGLLPCPSALVVLLSAISLHRVGYGLALVLAFSVGLAATLTGIGLAFVYAKRFVKHSFKQSRVVRVLPVLSAFIIACVGAAICYEALAQSGIHLFALTGNALGQSAANGFAGGEPSLASVSAFAVLGLGLVFGLKHATEVDHVVAVSTIVSEHRNVFRSALVGVLWGVGHTASLIVVGGIVLALRIEIPERIANWLEFCVALMIIILGINALTRALSNRADVHVHVHSHDGFSHKHVHFHEEGATHFGATAGLHSHTLSRIGFKPLLVGAMHGLAGSAALTLLVLTQIESVALGLLYLTVFGVGSIVGMLLMSGLIGLPFALSSRRLSHLNSGLRAVAGALSITFGLWYAYETGIASGLLRSLR